MPGANGRADLVGPTIQLGDFLPEHRIVVLNGQQYSAWVTTNKRYPRSIMARLDRAAREYNRVILPLLQPLAEGEEPSEARYRAAEEQPEAWSGYVTKAVLLLIPQLQESELELVDLDSLETLLRDLGYFPPLPQPSEDGEGEQTETALAEAPNPLPETTTETSTGDSLQPDLLTSTPGPVLTSS